MSVLVRPPKRKLSEPSDSDERRKESSRIASWKAFDRTYSQSNSRQPSEQPDTCGNSHSQSISTNATPVPISNHPFQTPRNFSPKASIVLVGIRGTGKSSLAVILATSSGRRLIDADHYFHQVTGCSRAEFKKDNENRQQEVRVFQSMLEDNKEGCVIVCGGGLESCAQELLRDYAQSHPVIHVTRDPDNIQSYLKKWNTEKVRLFLLLSGPVYRGLSNLEFFNLSEPTNGDNSVKEGHIPSPGPTHAHSPFLTLKRLQRDFLRFIAFVTNDVTVLTRQHASFPLSLLPVQARSYTSAISVPFSALCEQPLDIEELEYGSDAFELVIDMGSFSDELSTPWDMSEKYQQKSNANLHDSISQVVSIIRRHIIVPLIYHVDGHVTKGSASPAQTTNESYFHLVFHGLRLAPAFVTVDLSRDESLVSEIVRFKGCTSVIGHFEAFRSLPGGWDGEEYMKIYERAKRIGCDMVRICQPAEKMEDNFAVESFRSRVRNLPGALPLIAYNTGPLGRKSRCCNPILTPVTHPALIHESPTEMRSSITAREAQQALYSSFTVDPMRFYVFGVNVTYSMSPAMHNTAFKLCGMPHQYSLYQSPTLRGLNDLVQNQFFGGSSVSLPYKTEVIPLLHSMSPHAQAIGAVNTLIPIRDMDTFDPQLPVGIEKCRAGPVVGLHGDNTDWIGICNCIRRGLSPANAVCPSTTGLVIGSGGMARAAIYSMIHLGVQNIFVWNKTLANAEKLAHHYNRQERHLTEQGRSDGRPRVMTLSSLGDPWPVDYKQPTIIVSGIPAHSIGGQPAPNFNVPCQWLESPTGGVVIDLAYKPLHTPLMKQIRALSHRGWVPMDGLDVLPEQGFAQFELFTGRRAPRRLMRNIVLQKYVDEDGNHDASYIKDRLQNLDGNPS
ncbi:Shikimate kinase [Penicillium taxi]|uniref:Shikimate kinase n=1 Tax=Penicillium taxi TaxID=168475 RepID=UPI002545AF89|nr:Shikimate kinase [Penicillium taxi]KAJ5894022.1 Shikimate kinase [Penicillium taxi]